MGSSKHDEAICPRLNEVLVSMGYDAQTLHDEAEEYYSRSPSDRTIQYGRYLVERERISAGDLTVALATQLAAKGKIAEATDTLIEVAERSSKSITESLEIVSNELGRLVEILK